MNTDVEETKSRLNIVDILGEYIRLDKAGANYRALCPFHNEKSPSFMVSEEKQIWHCFGCQKGGDIFGFVMEMEGLEFRETLKMLAEKAGVKLQNYNPEKAEVKNKTLEILELATKFFEVQLWKGEGKEKILNYLHERGLKDEIIKDFRLGYAPKGWRNILNFLMKRGYSAEEIMRTGLLVQKDNTEGTSNVHNGHLMSSHYDRFRDRIMFPISDYSGKVLGYSARVSPGGDESQAKYVNTPETEVYHKSRVLYGIDKARSEIKQKNSALLVEGNMDVIALHQSGIRNVMAVSGTALTEEQVGIIKRYAKNIKMFFDMDSAGEQATKKSVKLCLKNGLSVKIVNILEGKDAADLAKDDPEKLKKAVEEAFLVMDYFFRKTLEKFDKNKIEDKKRIAEEILDIILSLENEVEKNHWIKKLGEELDISETALTDEFRKISFKNKSGKSEKDGDKFQSKNALTKKEMFMKELIGLMLISREVWEEAQKELEKNTFKIKDNLLERMLKDGKDSNFSFDNFIKKIINDQELANRAENIFFQKKYQLNLNNNLEEVVIEKPMEDFTACLREIKKEIRKDKLNKIGSDLKIAEERKDKEAILFLRQEFDKISKELSE